MPSFVHLSIRGFLASSDELFDCFRVYQQTVIAAATDAGYQQREITLAVSAVEASRQTLIIGANKPAAIGSALVSQAIRERDFSLIPSPARTTIESLWTKSQSRRWLIELQSELWPPTLIDPAVPLPRTDVRKEEAVITARVMRVDDRRCTVQLRLPTGSIRTFALATEQLAQSLLQLRYLDVALGGQARVFAETGKLAEFTGTELVSCDKAD